MGGVGQPRPTEPRTLAEIECDAIRRALERRRGNRRRVAAELEIGERTLYDKLKRYELS